MKFLWTLVAIFAYIIAANALKDPICGFPTASDGKGLIKCAAYIPSWSYNPATNECISFVYGGCGGNANRFGSQEQCNTKCKE